MHHHPLGKQADPGAGPGSAGSAYRPGTKIESLEPLSTTEA